MSHKMLIGVVVVMVAILVGSVVTVRADTGCDGNCCGPGAWYYDSNPSGSGGGNYTTPYNIVNGFGSVVGSGGGYSSYSTDQSSSCSAYANAYGQDGWSLFSYSFSAQGNANASYNYSEPHYWQGTGPACARQVSLAASGGGSENVSVTCGANSGSNASAAASGSGSCQSLGNAFANLSMHGLSLTAQYNSGNSASSFNGNGSVNGRVTDNSAGGHIQGSYDASSSWSTSGSGSASGSASYSVVAPSSYSGCTNSAYTKTRSGNCACNGSGSFGSPGSMSASSSSQVNLSV